MIVCMKSMCCTCTCIISLIYIYTCTCIDMPAPTTETDGKQLKSSDIGLIAAGVVLLVIGIIIAAVLGGILLEWASNRLGTHASACYDVCVLSREYYIFIILSYMYMYLYFYPADIVFRGNINTILKAMCLCFRWWFSYCSDCSECAGSTSGYHCLPHSQEKGEWRYCISILVHVSIMYMYIQCTCTCTLLSACVLFFASCSSGLALLVIQYT